MRAFQGKPWRWIPVFVALFSYYYFATSGRLSLKTLALQAEPTEGYQYLTKGFLMGRLGLSLDPDPKFVALADPYDPSTHGLVAVWDTAYYKGHFYLMHGPLPVLLFYLPVRLLFGGYATGDLVMLVFGSLNFLCLYALLLRVKDQHFPDGKEAYTLLGGLSIAVGNIVLANMVRSDFYFVCITSSEGVLAAGLYGLYRALEGGPQASRWMALASLGVGAAVAGRPSMVMGAFVFLAGASAWVWQEAGAGRIALPERARLLKAAWLPLVAIGALLALYNYLRFGNPLEFGVRYMISSIRMSDSGFMSMGRALANIAFNLKVDFLQRFLIQQNFPFIRASLSPLFQTSLDPYYFEDNIGFFSAWPTGWLLVLLPAALLRWRAEAPVPGSRRTLSFFVTVMGCMAVVQALVILSLSTNTYRYLGDFAPSFLVLMVVAAWLLLDLRGQSRWRALLSVFFEVGTVFGVLVTLNYAFCSWHCLFAAKVPELQRFLNSLARL